MQPGECQGESVLSMNELVENVLFQCLMVVLDTIGLTQLQGVTAMRQDHRHNLVLIVQQVAVMDMRDGNFVLDPSTIAHLT